MLVLHCHDLNYEWFWQFTSKHKLFYCAKHGYNMQVYRFGDVGRSPHWGRVHGIKHWLGLTDWLFYFDTDIVITNPTIKVESFIDDNFDCMVGRMPTAQHVSTSGILLRNCEWSFKMLDKWWECYNDSWFSDSDCTRGGNKFFDQSGWHRMFDENDWVRDRVKILDGKNFNNESWSWKEGDFVLHVPGLSQAAKIKSLMSVLKKYNIAT